MIYLAAGGWTMFVVAIVLLHLDYRDYEKQLEGKENARSMEENESKRLAEEIVVLRAEIHKLLGAALVDEEIASDLQYRLSRFDRPRKNGRFVRAK